MKTMSQWLLRFLVIPLGVAACGRRQSGSDRPETTTTTPPVSVIALSEAAPSTPSPKPAVQTEPGTLRLVVVHSHELTRAERMALLQMRAELQRPSKWPIRVIEEPATEDERRFLDEYLARLEQRAPATAALPPAWLRSETVVAIPIHPPIPFGGQELRAGYRDLLIFHPPAPEAVYTSRYRDDKVYGPNPGNELGSWLKRHLQLRTDEVRP